MEQGSCGVSGYFGGNRSGFGGGCGDHGGEMKGTRVVTNIGASSVNAGYD